MNITTTRRRFIEIAPTAGVALFAVCSAVIESTYAATAPATGVAALVGEKDAQAVALGYVDDAIRVDKVKFKAYIAGSQCSGCALYLGKAGDSAGGLPGFPRQERGGQRLVQCLDQKGLTEVDQVPCRVACTGQGSRLQIACNSPLENHQ